VTPRSLYERCPAGVRAQGDRCEYDRVLAAAGAALNEAAFVVAWAEGQAMTPDQAVAYALEGTTASRILKRRPTPVRRKTHLLQGLARAVVTLSSVAPLAVRSWIDRAAEAPGR
jgi:hypothetical protein